MIGAIFDHLWQSTVLALAAGLLTLALRKAGAPVRFGLWLAASLKFLFPFAALAALGGWLAPEVRPPAEATPGAILVARAVQPFSRPDTAAPAIQAISPVAHPAPHPDWTLVLAAIWALGCIAVLAAWMIRWSRVRRAVRQATPLALPAPMPVLASSWMREPGLVGLFRPVLLVPETLPDHLSQAEIGALVAHEACHLRRRDNLTAAIHMLVQALFWFHPLVWWIGSRLIQERERACDEAVVRAGHDRAAYARSLVECCRLYLQSPLPCVAGASGSNLRQRVEMIMTSPPLAPLSRCKKTLLMAAGACALATPVAAGWLTSPAGHDAAARVAAAAEIRIADAQPARTAFSAVSSDADDAPAPAPVVAEPEASAPPDAAARNQPSPGLEDAIRRWIAQNQLHQPDDEDLSPALLAAARPQQTMTMQVLSAFGPLQDIRFLRVGPQDEDVYEADFAHGKLEILAGPLTADGKLDRLNWRPIWARDGAPAGPGVPPPPVAGLDAPRLALTPVAGVAISKASLIPVSDRTSDGGQPLGPGHYVQHSGMKKSADCSGDSDVGADWYKLSTPPVAPGHMITNFQYELRGQNACDPRGPGRSASARCELATDKADRKTVRFQLFTNRNDCMFFQSSVRDGPQLGNAGASGSITQPGAVTQSEMVFSYDVQ